MYFACAVGNLSITWLRIIAVADNEKKDPGFMKAVVDLCRPFTMLAPAVGVYAGAMMAAEGKLPQGMCIIAAIVGGLLNAASNALNQITDLDIDRVNKPERPIPSGRMSIRTAAAIAALLYIICLVVSYIAVGPGFFLVIVIGAIFSLAYSIPPIRTKNNPILANPTMAIPRGILLILAGYVAQLELTRELTTFGEHTALLWNATPWAAGIIMFLFLLGAASTKDFADIEGDEAHGARTIPVVLGVKRAAWFMAPFFVIPYLLIIVAVLMKFLIPATLPLVLLAIYGAFIAWLIVRDPESLALEGNHPSWKHMYLLMMVTQIGFGIAYLVGS
jgi:geranylgeranylglycerol-phosphate geranylgeranyltransferase